jgi:hypothetical protein
MVNLSVMSDTTKQPNFMKKTFRLIVALLLLGGWSLAATALHVVYTGSSVIIIPKNRLGVGDTYVNISNWTADDVSNHPAVVARLMATGKTDTLANVFQSTGGELTAKVQEALAHGPTTQPSPTILDKAKEVAQQATQVVQH